MNWACLMHQCALLFFRGTSDLIWLNFNLSPLDLSYETSIIILILTQQICLLVHNGSTTTLCIILSFSLYSGSCQFSRLYSTVRPIMHPQTCLRFLFRSSLNIQKGFYSIMWQRLISSVYILLLVKFKGWKQYWTTLAEDVFW